MRNAINENNYDGLQCNLQNVQLKQSQILTKSIIVGTPAAAATIIITFKKERMYYCTNETKVATGDILGTCSLSS